MKLLSLITLFVFTLLFGCALVVGPAVEKIAKAVIIYCAEPYAYRGIYTNTVNSYLTDSGHVVHIHCDGDPTVE